MKHKHAEVIKAWADGATIQFKASPYDKWVTLTDTPEWKTDMEYRVKPRVGLKPRDNQIRIELGFKTTHADERMLYCEDALGNWLDPIEQLAKFADAVRYDEREANAKLCEKIAYDYTHDRNEDGYDWPNGDDCAAAIRAR